MDKKKIKYMINPKYLKSCVDLELKKMIIDDKYAFVEEKITNASEKLKLPKSVKDKLEDVNLNNRNEQIVKACEEIRDEQIIMEEKMDKKIELVKVMIKERMNRHE